MSDSAPIINIGPGEMLKDDLEYHGWSQEDFAAILGMSVKAVNEILNDKVPLTVETASLIGKALGTSAEVWINLNIAYRLRLHEENERERETAAYASVMRFMPIREMVKKGWLKEQDSAARLVKEAKAFWEVREPDFSFLEKRAEPCFRRSADRKGYEKYYALAWTQKAALGARKLKLPSFDPERAMAVGAGLPALSLDTRGPERLIEDLKKAGVGFLVLSHLSKTYLDGAALFIKGNPCIFWTGRYDRSDNFWFTIAHELAHVALDHLRSEGDEILDDLKEEAADDRERAADKLAEGFLRGPEILDFCEPYRQYLSKERIERCAKALGLHPGIVVGRLQHEGFLSYKSLNSFKAPVLDSIPASHRLG
jgi:HTH-type transcriptional regulator/antitoxin HigA